LFRHKFHYINQNKIIFLCLSEQMTDTNAFAFLNDIKIKLFQSYNYETLNEYSAFQLTEFTEILKQYMVR
jgi:hypothetical protein